MKIKMVLVLIMSMLLLSCINTDEANKDTIAQSGVDKSSEIETDKEKLHNEDELEHESKNNKNTIAQGEVDKSVEIDILQDEKTISQEEKLLLGAEILTEEIIYSVYWGEENYKYEVLLYALASDDTEGNLYEGYFPFDEERQSFIFSMDRCYEVLKEVFGEKEYFFDEYMFDYDEETDIYYKCLDFGWNTGYIADNITASISDNKSELYTSFGLINLWYSVDGDPVPTCIADCKIMFNIVKDENRSYLRFERIDFE